MPGDGRATERRISMGESSEEWLISTVGTMVVVSREGEYRWVGGIVRVFETDWGCGRWIVEVYKRFPGRVH